MKDGISSEDITKGGVKTMILWMMAGYALTAVAFYSYIVKTAQEEPQESVATVIDLLEWQRSRDEGIRKAA